jgi:hypothetical protein
MHAEKNRAEARWHGMKVTLSREGRVNCKGFCAAGGGSPDIFTIEKDLFVLGAEVWVKFGR